eukprot:g6674.t1
MPNTGFTPLEAAIAGKKITTMKLLLDEGADVEWKCSRSWTPLMSACGMGFLNGVKILTEYGAKLSTSSTNGLTAFLVAAKKQRLSVVSYLLELESCSITDTSNDGQNALHMLVLSNDGSICSQLIEKGIDIDAQTLEGETPLYLATIHNCVDSLRVLLEAGADPDIVTKNGECAIGEAKSLGHDHAAEILTVYGAGTASDLVQAIVNNDLGLLEYLVDSGADIEQRSGRSMTPLIAACNCGFLEGVKFLVERDANMSASSLDGITCLLVASKKRREDVLSYLLEQESCPVTNTDIDGYSALHYIVLLDNPDITSCIISKGADINAKNQDGESPVFLATKNNCVDSLRVLLEAGADPNVKTESENYALHEAVNEGYVEAVMLLLSHGADRKEIKKDGKSPVDLALSVAISRQINCTRIRDSLGGIGESGVLQDVSDVSNAMSSIAELFKVLLG